VADDTTRTAILSGSFTSSLKNLASNTTYYVRAYATNSVGAGYGEVRTIITGNEAPVASNVTISGEIKGDIEVTVTYTYTDKESDLEEGTTIQWYRADNASGTNTVAIPDATTNKYRISDADQGKVIWVAITPKAAAGTQQGVEATSEKKGPVGEATTVTFMYDGLQVTYGVINSTKTGRRWLDRNLGAPNAPSAYNDYVNIGDLFQWGRLADGHQLIKRTADAGNAFHGASSAVNGTTTILSSSDTPGHNQFIQSDANLPCDWRNPQKDNLWQGVDGINNPCPAGWRVPSIDEWTTEQLGDDIQANFSQMRFTHTGKRSNGNTFSASNAAGYYWSSTIDGQAAKRFYQSDGNTPTVDFDFRASAYAVRCIKPQ
jgi:hypothetical protein